MFKYRSVVNSTVIFLLEPFHSLLFANSVLSSNFAFTSSSKTNSASWSFENNVEVHTENTSEWIILDTQIDVFLNTETKATSIWEISLFQFSIFDFKTSLENLVSFIASDGDMYCNFLVSFDTKASNGETSSWGYWLLSSQVFKHFTSYIIIISNLW